MHVTDIIYCIGYSILTQRASNLQSQKADLRYQYEETKPILCSMPIDICIDVLVLYMLYSMNLLCILVYKEFKHGTAILIFQNGYRYLKFLKLEIAMVKSCALYGCSNYSSSGSDLSFFSFPKDEKLRRVSLLFFTCYCQMY